MIKVNRLAWDISSMFAEIWNFSESPGIDMKFFSVCHRERCYGVSNGPNAWCGKPVKD
ncbi:hypothetical protein BCEN4_330084 [Burkholderia cenocepacia]|nr:hypothetical protein BCEN4_330084 [Burkholderia cenocepacia]